MRKRQKAFTLVEVLVATFLISIVFLGIFGGFHLAMRVVAQSKAKMQAVYFASQRIEEIRNLSFAQIQTGEATLISDNISYNVQTIVEDFDDCADGTIEGFDCQGNSVPPDTAPNDYKKVKVRVFWEEFWGGEIILSTSVVSKGLETGAGKGALRLSTSDSLGQLIEISTGDQLPPCPADSIYIANENTGLNQCYGTDPNNPGVRLLILDVSVSPDDYKIIINKEGYNITQTFKAGDVYNSSIIASPLRKNPTISEGELYPATFIIDELSDLTINTVAPWGGGSFFDSFSNEDKISEINNLVVDSGEVELAISGPGAYFSSGYLISETVFPSAITEWYQLVWSDFEELGTDIKCQIFYATSTDWHLIPDSDLPGNALGFDSSPVDLSELNPSEFFKLKIRADFSTSDLEKTPVLYEWELSWKNGEATPISNVSFSLRGDKIVGTDADEQLIYKYSTTHSTDLSGIKALTGMETDDYYFSDLERDGQTLNLNTELSPMPFNLLPGTSTSAILYLEAENSLLVKVEDASTTEPIFGATAELSNTSLEYNQNQSANQEGEALFIPLDGASNYTLNVKADDYYEKSYSLDIWGNAYKNVSLERYE
jgi:prepilin-type N-terminal cleavage/methylation domain-containing protein